MDDRARSGRRLEPDPKVRGALLAAATELIRAEGVRALSVASVLDRASLGTRAFYRHFDSKDQLVAAVFLEMARAESRRLRKRMVAEPDPVRAVVAWIDGRLDLAFHDEVESDLRQMSLEAQSQMVSSPEIIGAAYAEILVPLVEQLERGRSAGRFVGADPPADALAIQGVLWSSVERHWAIGDGDRHVVRRGVLRFCLRGLGVAPESVEEFMVGGHTRDAARRIAGDTWTSD